MTFNAHDEYVSVPAFMSSTIILRAITDYKEIYIITIYYFSTKYNQGHYRL